MCLLGPLPGLWPTEPTLLSVSPAPWNSAAGRDPLRPGCEFHLCHSGCVTLASLSTSLNLTSCLSNGANKQLPSDRIVVRMRDITEAVAALGLAQAPEGLEKALRTPGGPDPQNQGRPLGGTPSEWVSVEGTAVMRG